MHETGGRELRFLLGLFLIATATAPAPAAQQVPMPAVTGISHIAFYVHDLAAAEHFYGYILGGAKSPDPEDAAGARHYFGRQFIEGVPGSQTDPRGRLA